MEFPFERDILSLENVFDWNQTQERVSRVFWSPDPRVVTAVVNMATQLGASQIIELGADREFFPGATTQINVIKEKGADGVETIVMDADEDIIPRPDGSYDFAYSRHTLEDLQNPAFAFRELTRVATSGYIETPSPLIEILRYIDFPTINEAKHRGFVHHRYFVWTELEDNSLHFLPKFPIVEYLRINPSYETVGAAVASNTGFAWNNYYWWSPEKPPKYVMHKAGVNFEIVGEYGLLIERAIKQSFETAKVFAREVCGVA